MKASFAVIVLVMALAFLVNCSSTQGADPVTTSNPKPIPSPMPRALAKIAADLEEFSRKIESFRSCTVKTPESCALLADEINSINLSLEIK